jgi:hypothetical protein
MWKFLHCYLSTSQKKFQSVEYIYWCIQNCIQFGASLYQSPLVRTIEQWNGDHTCNICNCMHFHGFEPCHWLARTGFVSLWDIHVSDKVNFALLQCNVLQQTCITLPAPVNTNIRKQCVLPTGLMLAALWYQKT